MDDENNQNDWPFPAAPQGSAPAGQTARPMPPDASQTAKEPQSFASGLGMVNSASTAISDIPPEFQVIGLKKIRDILDGNGIKGEDIKPEHFEGVTLQFLATTKLQFRFKTLERVEAGRKPGKVLPSTQAIREEITKQEDKITHRADIIKRVQQFVTEERKDKGYGLDGHMIKFPFLYTDYVYYEACQTCQASGKVHCKRCHGQGFEMCSHCHGQGLEICTQCNGTHFMNTPKGRVQCNRCHGRGKISCSVCHERRKVQCRICRTKGSTQCTVCNGHAWNTRIYRLEIDAMPAFDYDRANIKDRLADVIDALGPELVTANHAQVEVIYRETEEKDSAEDKRNYITIPYVVKLPFGELRYKVGDEIHNTMIFGYNAELRYFPFLLDRLLATPLKRLQEAAENRGNVAEKIHDCAQYRTMRQAILAASRLPLKKAAALVKKQNPDGLRNKTVKAMVIHADKALKNVTRKPREQAFYIGLVLMVLIYTGYFATGANALVPVANPLLPLGLDLGVFAAGIYLAIFVVKFMSKRALHEALGALYAQEGAAQKKMMPKTGKIGERIAMAAPLLYGLALEAGYRISGQASWWYQIARDHLASLF